ncbi:COG3904 family protein [Histidinibacterium aquaticum]|uniref:Clp protease n=1 Tax=Histidinibacterium aquaticum TaxID=2613962 RepID=A0A5J5GBR7_9RHOB|nr:hypothetical protein [Histidinibacterium aquaticum]KAA9005599.1 hypothetical protein F3S47_16985 [Histidinibacterium aquaticum]
MTDTTETPEEERSPRDTRRMLKAILLIQVGLAGVLIASDMLRVLPGILDRTEAPALTEPLRPGDQTRRYRPEELSPREGRPGTRPVPIQQDMPSRLMFETATWEGRPTLILTGMIAAEDSDRLTEHLETLETPPELVFLNSSGGSVRDALGIGRTLRDLGAETRMTEADICLSACPYVLASGTVRQVEEGAMVGVHQHFFGQNTALPAFLAVEDIQRGQGLVMAYLDEMGVDPMLMEPALLTPPNEIYLLTAEEMAEFGLTTPVAEEASAN